MEQGGFHHRPVLLHECIEGLFIRDGGVYVDGTTGGGGHSLEIAQRLKTGTLVCIDKDPQALRAASERLRDCTSAQFVQGDFGDMTDLLDGLAISGVDGILLDLGVSSHQLDTPERGFSYHQDAPLDMRMSGSGRSARDILESYSTRELIRIFREYGEEKYASRIASLIVQTRTQTPIETTGQLVDIIKAAIPAAARREGGHPAKRVFQAVRIEVNGELESLRRCLESAFDRLKPGGRFVIITFHSLEDRMVKRHFAEYAKGCTCPPDFPICVCGKKPRAKLIGKRPILPGPEELDENNRGRSAKLRILERL